jgi:farnesyl-diphosphate farnesyltransferase
MPPNRLLTDLLKSVSRSFYLTLRILPGSLREPIGLAYLLARAADTIADTRIVPPDKRLHHLLAFRQQVVGPVSSSALRALKTDLLDKQEESAEQQLIDVLPSAFDLLAALPEQDNQLIRQVVVTLINGMEIDLTIFPPEQAKDIKAFQDAKELDNYIYHVAGCVGKFWTKIMVAHTSALSNWNVDYYSNLGIRFGKALQLTNILRDLPKDLRIGRCYLPQTELQQLDLTPVSLLSMQAGPTAGKILNHWISVALDYYLAAEEYALAIPRRCIRLRLAALWPMLIGLATLQELAKNEKWLNPACTSKISRTRVYKLILKSICLSLSNRLLRNWIERLRKP